MIRSAPFISVNQNILSIISRIIIWGEIPTITVFYAHTATSTIMLLILTTTPTPTLLITRKRRWRSLPYSCMRVLGAYSTLLGQRKVSLEVSLHCQCSNVVLFLLYYRLVCKSVNCSTYLLLWSRRIIENITKYYFFYFSLRRLRNYASLSTFYLALWMNAVVFESGLA